MSDDQPSHCPASNACLDQVGVLERADLPVEPEPGPFAGGVALGGRALGDADDRVGHVGQLREAAVAGDHHPLAVVERRLQERRAFGAVTCGGPRRVAHEHVDLAGLQRGEAVGGVEVDESRRPWRRRARRRRSRGRSRRRSRRARRCVEEVEAGQLVAGAAAHHTGFLNGLRAGSPVWAAVTTVSFAAAVVGGVVSSAVAVPVVGRCRFGCVVAGRVLVGRRRPSSAVSPPVSAASSSSLVQAPVTSTHAAATPSRRDAIARVRLSIIGSPP